MLLLLWLSLEITRDWFPTNSEQFYLSIYDKDKSSTVTKQHF